MLAQIIDAGCDQKPCERRLGEVFAAGERERGVNAE
jgi:hypothetical protein